MFWLYFSICKNVSFCLSFYAKLKIPASLLIQFWVGIQRPIKDLIVYLEFSVTFLGMNWMPSATTRHAGESELPVQTRRPDSNGPQIVATAEPAGLSSGPM